MSFIKCSTTVVFYFGILVITVRSQIAVDPCDDPEAILVPEDRRCLVLFVDEAQTWSDAQAFCERRNGTLYRIPYGRLENRPALAECLASIPTTTVNDLWIDAVGIWSPHYIWINQSVANPVDYCPLTNIPRDSSVDNWNSDWLSVEYCVTNCRLRRAQHTIISVMSNTFRGTPSTPKCWCDNNLNNAYKVPCTTNMVDYNDPTKSFIFEFKPDSLIVAEGMNTLTDTQVMCATVSTTSYANRNYSSITCFTEIPYFCCIGDASYCNGLEDQCDDIECYLRLDQPINKCVLRVNRNRNWFAARAHCDELGGDLWNPHFLDDMISVLPVMNDRMEYYIGATNYGWNFATKSTAVTENNLPTRKCGHMFREQEVLFRWGDTVCDQQKQFICEFRKETFTREQYNNPEANCPWPITVEIPVDTMPLVGTAEIDEDPFPLAAVLSAIVAGIILLTLLGLAFSYCWRRGWLAGGFQKVRERLAFIPYFADMSQMAEYEGHAANMSSVSEHGSQTGLVKGGYHAGGMSAFAMSSSSYMEQSNGGGHLDATYATMPKSGTDYMTLQAQMEIKDDAELNSLHGSVRRKPEVALVTDNVDMNFTVNKAVNRTHSHAGSERSRSSLDRTMEDIHSERGGVALSLPERVAEAKYYTHTTGH